MNQQDRDSLADLYSVIANDIPWPNRNKTIGIEDAGRMFWFFSDQFVPRLLRCVMAISRVDDPAEDRDKEIEALRGICRSAGRSDDTE